MLSNSVLPAPDGSVLGLVGLFVIVLALGAWAVWRRDRRAASRRDAIPQQVAETAPSPRHVLPGASGSTASSVLGRAEQAGARNLRGQGHMDNGPVPLRLWMTVAEVAHVFPQHSFVVEILFDARGLSIAEPDFSLCLASLLLHAAQIGRSHRIELSPLAPGHPHYRHSDSPQFLVRIWTDTEQASLLTFLGERAIACCQLAGGVGSIEADTNLWLVWPTSKAPVSAEQPASDVSPAQSVQVGA